jgi:hypothetical protein
MALVIATLSLIGVTTIGVLQYRLSREVAKHTRRADLRVYLHRLPSDPSVAVVVVHNRGAADADDVVLWMKDYQAIRAAIGAGLPDIKPQDQFWAVVCRTGRVRSGAEVEVMRVADLQRNSRFVDVSWSASSTQFEMIRASWRDGSSPAPRSITDRPKFERATSIVDLAGAERSETGAALAEELVPTDPNTKPTDTAADWAV